MICSPRDRLSLQGAVNDPFDNRQTVIHQFHELTNGANKVMYCKIALPLPLYSFRQRCVTSILLHQRNNRGDDNIHGLVENIGLEEKCT